jgi:hypothetical protein
LTGQKAESRNQKIFTKGNEGNEGWREFAKNAEFSVMALPKPKQCEMDFSMNTNSPKQVAVVRNIVVGRRQIAVGFSCGIAKACFHRMNLSRFEWCATLFM